MGSVEPEKVFHCDVLIVGAGFSGVYGLHKFRKLGLNVKVFEAGGDLGGTWYWNRYPGARVDSEWPYYQLTIPEVWKDFDFAERFPNHEEIRRYFAHADKVLDLKKDIQFNARVNSADWNGDEARWTVRTEAGHVAITKYLCLFTGLLYRPYSPEFPGFEKYKGVVHHSISWPENVDVTGKKVAVIGAGATGVQIVQELSKKASQFCLFIRRPSLCAPIGNRPISEVEHDSWKPYFPVLFDAGRKSRGGFPMPSPEKGIFELSDAEREAYFEKIWKPASFHFVGSNFPETYLDPKANRLAYDFWVKKVRARFTDPVKRDLMAPLEPPYPIFTRRVPLENDYYECLDQEHVEIVSLKATPVKTFTETGIITEDGKLREFDYVVLATGFDSFTGSITSMNLKSKNGVDIKDIWKEGVRTYLGMHVHGFPNCFMSYGPHSPAPLSNGPTLLESQVNYIVDAIAKMEKEGLGVIEPTAEAEEEWKQTITTMGDYTLVSKTDSWWTAANIPGKPREMLTYVGGIPNYEAQARATLEGWKGFEVKTTKV